MDIGNLNNADLVKFLCTNKEYLKMNNVRDLLMNDDRHYAFVWLVQDLDDYSYIYDEDMISRIINNRKFYDKMNAIMSSGNENNLFMHNNKILDVVFSKGLSPYLYSINYNDSIYVMNYFINKNKEEFFRDFNRDVKYKLLNDPVILEKLLSSPKIKKFLTSLDQSCFGLLINDKRCQNVVANSNIEYVDYLMYNGAVFPMELCDNDRFKRIFLDIQDVSLYRNEIDKLEVNNGYCANKIDELRFKDYDFIVLDYVNGYSYLSRQILSCSINNKNYDYLFNDNMLKYFTQNRLDIHKIDDLKRGLYLYDKMMFKEILIDRFFKDVPDNFIKNLSVMVNYIKKTSLKVDNSRLSLYEKILNFDNMSNEEQKKLYNECKEIPDLSEKFYDDYRFAKDKSYTNLIENAYDPFKKRNDFSKEKSAQYNTVVFELNGDNFFTFVHVTGFSKDSKNVDNVWNDYKTEGLSLSYISDKNITTFSDPFNNIVLGFNNLDYNRFVHLRNSDSFSSYSSDKEDASGYVQKMYTPEDLIKNTKGYNEIVYQERSSKVLLTKVRPDYVVCYNNIGSGDVLLSKKLNIPIVLIHTNKYKYVGGALETLEEDKYKIF